MGVINQSTVRVCLCRICLTNILYIYIYIYIYIYGQKCAVISGYFETFAIEVYFEALHGNYSRAAPGPDLGALHFTLTSH